MPAVLVSAPEVRLPAVTNGTFSPAGMAAAELLAGIDHFSGDEVDRLLDQLLAPHSAELAGRTAVITGGSRGIGAAIAVALGQRAANVVINYHSDPAPAEETAAAVNDAGGQAVIVKANVGDPAQVAALVEAATRSFGGVDILIGNAASGVPRPLLEQNDRAWDYTLDINARSILRGAWAAAPGMRARGWGRIIGLTSIGAGRVLPNYGVVGVSKAAIESLIRTLAAELAPYGICCNAVSPGLIVTDSVKHFPNLDQLVAAALTRTPTGRLVTVEQVAAVVAFLCTEAAAGIVGQTIVVDGGYAVMA
jgi:enoyl-[acyl-carrier protein] reductase III